MSLRLVGSLTNDLQMIFVGRIDVGAEALRSPDEIGRMLKDAEGKLGALTEVFDGTCVVANMCPAKLACVGLLRMSSRSSARPSGPKSFKERMAVCSSFIIPITAGCPSCCRRTWPA